MPTFLRSLVAVGFLAAAPSCTVLAQTPPDLGAEARAFMDAYARDLQARDAESVIRRYDPRGAVILIGGQGGARTWAQIADVYRTAWRGPLRFSWRDLLFDVVAPDAVIVRGGFLYQAVEGGPDLPYAYLAVLVWDGGALRIVFEEESPSHPGV